MSRGERRIRTRRIVRQQLKILRRFGMLRFRRNPARFIGRCKKTKALDCGHTHCFACNRAINGHKRVPTRHEILAFWKFEEEVRELVA